MASQGPGRSLCRLGQEAGSREALGAWLSGAGPGGVSAGLCSHLGQLCRQDTTAELARCSRPTERDGMSSDQSARSSGRALDPGGQVWPCRVRNFRSRNPLGKGWAGPATSHPGRMGRGQGLEGAGRSRLERIVGPGWIGPGRARAGRPGPDIGLFRERPRSSSQTKLRPSIVSREDIPYFHGSNSACSSSPPAPPWSLVLHLVLAWELINLSSGFAVCGPARLPDWDPAPEHRCKPG